MPRRNNQNLLALAARSHWSFAAGLAVIGLLFGLIAPIFLRRGHYTALVAPLLQKVAFGAALLFGLVATIRFLMSRHTASGHQPPRERIEPKASRAAREPVQRVVPGAVAADPIRPSQWSLALLRAVEWNRFERIVAAYFQARGIRCETTGYGADGGIDAKIYAGDPDKPIAVVQCKAWMSDVGIKPIRELAGVMAHEKVSRGQFFTTADFTDEAIRFASANRINLVSGPTLLAAIQKMPEAERAALLDIATEGDYLTPTCASCGIKLMLRNGKKGEFWGCSNFPKCKTKMQPRPAVAV